MTSIVTNSDFNSDEINTEEQFEEEGSGDDISITTSIQSMN